MWNKFLDEILTNLDNDHMRSVMPIENDDKSCIIELTVTEALILWNIYFSETVKYALQFERTYGDSIEILIFDESEIDSETLKGMLSSMHTDETPILIYWNRCVAIKTTWGMFVKYWDNFFYYPEDAIIYVNQDQVYFYNEMILKKINKLKLKSISGESIFDCLQKLKDSDVKKAKQIDCLLEGIPSDFQEYLYYLFHIISEGFQVIESDEIRNEYMEYCLGKILSNTEKIVLASKPYSEKSLQDFIKYLDDKKKVSIEPSQEKFYEMLKKICIK